MPLLIAVMGPTASGKSSLAESLAAQYDARILNADAFQIYRGMDVGTAKPTNRQNYRLLDIKDPNEPFGVGEWIHLAVKELEEAWETQTSCIVVGGTGLYIRALFEEYHAMAPPPDPELRAELEKKLQENGLESLVGKLQEIAPEIAQKLDLQNPVRVRRALEKLLTPHEPVQVRIPSFKKVKIGLEIEVATLDLAIDHRVHQMVQNGWALEVQRLREMGYTSKDPGFRAIGYSQMWDLVNGDVEEGEAIAATIAATRRYSRRQRTWLRTEPGLTTIVAEPGTDLLAEAVRRIGIVC